MLRRSRLAFCASLTTATRLPTNCPATTRQTVFRADFSEGLRLYARYSPASLPFSALSHTGSINVTRVPSRRSWPPARALPDATTLPQLPPIPCNLSEQSLPLRHQLLRFSAQITNRQRRGAQPSPHDPLSCPHDWESQNTGYSLDCVLRHEFTLCFLHTGCTSLKKTLPLFSERHFRASQPPPKSIPFNPTHP